MLFLLACTGPVPDETPQDVVVDGDSDPSTFCDTYGAVVHDLTIARTDLTDLTPFSCLEEVRGDFTLLRNQSLTSLAGLDALTTIGGTFAFDEDELLDFVVTPPILSSVGAFDFHYLVGATTLGEWPALTEVPGDLAVQIVGPTDGFGALTRVGGELKFYATNPEPLSGFTAVASVGGLSVDGPTSITGLSSLTRVEGSAVIGYPSLVSLPGLAHLDTVGDRLYFISSSLPNMDDLGALREVGGDLLFNDNQQLVSLDGLYGVEHIGGRLQVWDNPLLTQDETEAFVAAVGESNIEGGVMYGGDGR